MKPLIPRLLALIDPVKARHVSDNLSTSLNYQKYGISYRDAFTLLKSSGFTRMIKWDIKDPKTLLGGVWGISHLLITMVVLILFSLFGLLW